MAEGEPPFPEATIEVFQDDPRFRRGRARARIDLADPTHPAEIEHEGVRAWAGTAHEARASSPWDDREARGLGEAHDGHDIFGGAGPHDRCG